MESPQHFTLKQVAESIRKTIAERYSRTYWVTAEMHKLNSTRKGHCYPELVQKENDQIVVEMRGTIWKQNFDRIQARFAEVVKEPLRDGMELLFLVKITYHPIYNLGLEIIDIDPNYTLGALHRERQQTLERLQKERILNANQQLEMAFLPKRLAIISQADSKGYSDFVTLLNGHASKYHFDTLLFEATLQGDAAISSIQNQLKRIARVKHHFDAVVIIRGGGGEIGMHCYNNYDLAKAIATFPLPILTGIGHSTNLTVCEMIAFRNGITPSDMAYYLLGIFTELEEPVDQARAQLPAYVEGFMIEKRQEQERITREIQRVFSFALVHQNSLFKDTVNLFDRGIHNFIQKYQYSLLDKRNTLRFTAKTLFNQEQQTLIHRSQVFESRVLLHIQQEGQELQQASGKLQQEVLLFSKNQLEKLERMEQHMHLVDPKNVLRRGYAIVTNKKGVLKTDNAPGVNETVQIQTQFYQLKAKVEEIKNK
jgi:exodeoxyribonuclease VII large subunit